jgi:hypothetical protein
MNRELMQKIFAWALIIMLTLSLVGTAIFYSR